MRVIVKMCGNRSASDLIGAAEAGADLLGIIFADAWRRVSVEQAREMVRNCVTAWTARRRWSASLSISGRTR